MAILLVVLGVVVICGVAAWALRGRSANEAHSVDVYRQTLHTLEDIRTKAPSSRRADGAAPNGATPDAAAVARASGVLQIRTGPTHPVAQPGSHPAGPESTAAGGEADPIVFDEVSPRRAGGGGSGRPDPSPGGHTSRDRAMASFNHRPRKVAAPIAAVLAALVLVVVLVLAGAHSKSPTPPGHHPPTTVAGHHGATRSHRHTTAPTTTPTTAAPASFSPVGSSSAGSATYAPPAQSYTLGISASAACWVEIQSASSTPLATTLESGQQKSVPVSGQVTLELGAPGGVTVTLDNEPVVFPPGYQAPFTMTFTPASAAGA